ADEAGYGVALDLIDAGVAVAAVLDLRGEVPAAPAAAAPLAGDARIGADALLPERLTQKGGATATSAGLDFGTEERLT
ncbi:MAG TPA: hypothetical protein PKD61_26545, partial [Polyangiaceae bacterium]|nr:hypothetical protein [Polyangiaceae bacterium]